MSKAIGRYYIRFDWKNHIGQKSYVCLWKWTPASGWVGVTGEGELHFPPKDMKTPNEMTWGEVNYKAWRNVGRRLRA